MPEVTRVVMEGQGTFVRVRRPAFWAYVGLVSFGLMHIGVQLRGAFDSMGWALWVPAVLNGALAAVFIWVLTRMDLFEREPAAARAAAFVWGAVVAVSVAITANVNLLSLITKLFGTRFATEWAAAIAGPLNEEWLKTLGVVALVLIVREHFHRSIDGLIYGAFVGLGFQVVENLTYAINYGIGNPNSDLAGALSVTISRLLVAGPWSHPVYTGVAGLGVAFLVTRTRRSWPVRWGVAVACFLAALGMHALWNSPLPSWLPGGLSILVVYGKGLLILLFFLALYGYAARREWTWFGEIMTGQPESVITPAELESMRTLRTRRRARKDAGREYGLSGGRLIGKLQRAQLELGEAIARARRANRDPAGAPDVTVALANIASVRAELAASSLRRFSRKARRG